MRLRLLSAIAFPVMLAIILTSGILAIAGDPLPVENPVPPTSFGEVRLPLEKGDTAIWDITPEPTKITSHVEAPLAVPNPGGAGGTAVLHFNGPAGSYSVAATVVNFDAKTVSKKKVVVKITGDVAPTPPVPPVPPTPGPGPQPQPQPITGTPKRFVVVEDTTQVGAWRGDVLGSPKVASFYKASGLSHRLIDVNADGDDAAAIAYKKLAAGKALPYLWILDQSGKVIKDLPCPTDPDKFVSAFDQHAGKRALGASLAKPKLKWKKFGESPSVPLIPRDKWKPVDLTTFLPPVYDQDGRGQCASSSACTVYECGRAQAGLTYIHVSAGDLYSRVNGGSDEGSMPEDNLNELITNGVALASAVPYVWDGREHNDAATVASRKSNRIVEAYLCSDFDSMASALQQGFVCQEAIQWYDTDAVDGDGWIPVNGRGGGGHALCGFGLAQRNGTWGLKTRNSWSASWGNSSDGSLGAGNCIIPEGRFGGNFGNVWAVRAVYQSGSDFPVPKTSGRVDPLRIERGEFALAP